MMWITPSRAGSHFLPVSRGWFTFVYIFFLCSITMLPITVHLKKKIDTLNPSQGVHHSYLAQDAEEGFVSLDGAPHSQKPQK